MLLSLLVSFLAVNTNAEGAYHVGSSTLETCPSRTLIDDVEACKQAAGVLGEWDGTRNWSDRPYGCLLTVKDGDVNFNTNKQGTPLNPDQVVICSTTYHVGFSTSETCAPGTLIGNQEACKTAAGVLGEWDGTRNWSDRPYGCLLTSKDGDVNFNTNKQGTPSNPDQVVICNIAYYVGASTSKTCAPNTLIYDVKACKTAAGVVGEWDGSRNWSDRPFGCLLTVADGDVNFNTNQQGAPSNPDQVVICN